jgi:hypothetical protein
MMRGREGRIRRSSISWSPTRLYLVDMNRGPARSKMDGKMRRGQSDSTVGNGIEDSLNTERRVKSTSSHDSL